MGLRPLALMVPATVACSLSFSSHVETPPNAIAFYTGYLTVAEMVRAGGLMAAGGVTLTWLFSMTLWEAVFDFKV